MALYEVTLRQRYYDQQCLNVFAYAADEGVGFSPSAFELIELLGFVPTGDPLAFPADTLAFAIAAVQVPEVEFLSVEARELYSLTDFYEAVYSPPLAGDGSAGTAVSPAFAYGLFSSRTRLDIRRGFKRFVGVGENAMTAGGVLDSGTVSQLVDIADAMSVVLEGGASNYRPCVISRLKEAVPDTDPVKYRYVLYPTAVEQDEHIALGIEYAPYTTVRTQTSRQYGRGQ